MSDYTTIAVAVLSGLLLVFGLVGSAFLLRGYWVRLLLLWLFCTLSLIL